MEESLLTGVKTANWIFRRHGIDWSFTGLKFELRWNWLGCPGVHMALSHYPFGAHGEGERGGLVGLEWTLFCIHIPVVYSWMILAFMHIEPATYSTIHPVTVYCVLSGKSSPFQPSGCWHLQHQTHSLSHSTTGWHRERDGNESQR